MPSVSKQQQKFFGLVRALQKGDVSPSSVTKKARDAAKDMKKSDVKKYAATKHKGLPRKVRGETKVRELIKKMVREILDEQKLKQLAVIRSSQPQSPYTIFQDGNGFVMKGGRGFSLSFKDENTISKNTKSLKDYLNRVLGYWSYQKGKIKGINEGKLKEGFADNFIKTVDKHNQKIVNNALALAKQQAPKDIDKSSKKTPKLIAIKTINRMKELRNKTKSPALKKTFQKTIDKLEKDYKKIKEGKLTENEMTHITTKDTSKQKLLKLARMLPDLGLKNKVDYKLSSNGKILAINTKKIGLNQKKYFKKKLGIDLSEGKLSENKRQIAQTILQQLGGRRFIAMTGAKNIGFTNKGLSMKIGKNAKGITHVVVDYDRGKDLYDMEFVKIRGTKRTGKKVKSVYADDLKTIFKGYTGLRTSL